MSHKSRSNWNINLCLKTNEKGKPCKHRKTKVCKQCVRFSHFQVEENSK